jgi:regulator of protease activity HflC (stomatin/prohibitin superfamily)
MSQFVFGIVLLIVAAAVFLVARAAKAKVAGGFSLPANATPAQRAAAAAGPRAGQLISIAALALGLFLLGSSLIRVVPANTVGVPTTLGKVGSPLSAGLHVTAPWTEITEFSTRTQELSMLRAADEGDKTKDDSVSIIAKGGGSMAVDVTVRFALALDQAGELFRQAGSLQLVKDRFVRPDAREVVRNVFGEYTAEEGYSIKRAEIATKITELLKPRLASRGIIVDSVNVRDVAPDTQQLAAINAILQSRNEANKALEDQKKQTTEAETRKQVAALDKQASVTKAEADAAAVGLAATAQAEANDKIAKSLTPELLDLEKTKACANAIAQTKAQVVNVCAGSGATGGAAGSPATSVIVDTRNPATATTAPK